MIQGFFNTKRIIQALVLSLLLLGVGGAFSYAAPTPSVISYQGFLTSATGTAQTGTTTVTIRIYDQATSGTLLFEELHPTTPITNGFFAVQIGSVGDVNGGTAATSITDLSFDRSYYVTVELASPFSTGEMTLSGGTRSQLGTVPFATISYGALQATSSSSLTAQKGRMYFNTTSNELTLYNGSSWIPVVIQGASTTLTTLTVTGQTTLANASTTNLSVSNSLQSSSLTVTSATSTNLFATLLNAVTAVITNLTATNLTTIGTTTLATEGGRIAVGTTTPSKFVHITTADPANNQILFENLSTSSSAFAELRVSNGNLNTYIGSANSNYSDSRFAGRGWVYNNNHDSGLNLMSLGLRSDIRFFTKNTGDAFEGMRLTSNGNLLLGTTTATTTASLFIQGTSSTNPLVIASSSGNSLLSLSSAGLLSGISALFSDFTSSNFSTVNATATNLTTTGTTTLATLGGGVGIGTTTPAGSLHVVGASPVYIDRSASNAAHLALRSAQGTVTSPISIVSGNELGQLSFGGLSSSGGWVTNDTGIVAKATENWGSLATSGSLLLFKTKANSTSGLASTRMLIDQNGNIGIGTNNPTDRLTIAGNTTPASDSLYSLGSSSLRFLNTFTNNIFASSSVITNATTTSLSVTSLSTTNSLSAASNTITSNVGGSIGTSTIITSNVASSSANFFQTIVNGISSSVATLINSFTQSVTGNVLTTTVNGVAATTSIITSNALSTSGATLTTTINGVATSTDLTNLVASSTSNTLTISTSTNSFILTSVVNGQTATTTARFLNSNDLQSAVNTLTSTINGVATSTSIITSSTLSANTGVITTIINGVTATTSIANLYTFLASSTNSNLTIATTTGGQVLYTLTDTPIFSSSTIASLSTMNASSSNLFATLLNAVTAVITNLTATNATATNLVTTNSTSTNSFISSLVATLANITDLVVGNSTTTNAVVTNLAVDDIDVSSSLNVTGSADIQGATTFYSTVNISGQASLASASATALTVSDQSVFNTSSTTVGTVTTLFSTLANITNASTSNLSTSNSLSSSGLLTVLGTSSLATTTVSSLISTSLTFGNASSTGGLTLASLFGANLTACNTSTEKLLWANGTFTCGTDAGGAGGTITSLNGSSVASQTLATSTLPGVGLDLTIVSSTTNGVHSFALSPQAGYSIPLTASSSNWNSFFNSPVSYLTAGANILFSSTSTISLSANPSVTSITSTNASTTNITSSGQAYLNNASATNITVSNSLQSSNLTVTSATSTNLFSTLLTAITGIFTNLTATNATATNLVTLGTSTLATTTVSSLTVTGNTTITNASATNLTASGQTYLDNASATNITVSNSLQSSSLTVTSATSTSFFSTLLSAVTGIFTNLTATNATATNLSFVNGTSTGSLVIQPQSGVNPLTIASSTGANLFTIFENGNVAIGTTSSSDLLYLYSSSSSVTAKIESRGGTGTAQIAFINSGGRTWSAGTRANLNGSFVIVDETAIQIRFTIATSGNIGIGSSTPAYLLGVSGTFGVTGTSTLATTTVSSLIVTGQSTLANASTTNLTASGNVNVTGQTTLTTASATALTLSGNLNVAGQSTLATASATALTVSGQTVLNTSSTTVGTVTTLFSTLANITNASTTNITTSGNLYLSGLTAGSIPFIGTNGLVSQDNANFFFDNTNDRLGIGSSSPIATLSVRGVAGANPFVVASSTGAVLLSVSQTGLTTLSTASTTGAATIGGQLFFASASSTGGLTLAQTLNVTGQTTLTTASATALTATTFYNSTLYGATALLGTTTNTFDSSKLVVQGTTTLVGTTGAPTALRVMGNIDNTATSTVRPLLIASSSLSTGLNPSKTFISGNYLYTTKNGSSILTIVDISNTNSPTVAATTTTGSSPFGLYVSGKYAYVANVGADTVSVFDVSNPRYPSLAATISLGVGSQPQELFISGGYLYVTNSGLNSVSIINVSKPSSPNLVATVNVQNGPAGIYVSGKYVYVTNYSSDSLSIIDISNTSNPVVISNFAVPSLPLSVYVSGRNAYIASEGYGLSIVDISNPSSPVLTSSVPSVGSPYSLAVSGRYAYMTTSSNRLEMYDVSSSTQPTLASFSSTGSYPRAVSVVGRYAYVTTFNSNTLNVYDLGGLESTSAIIHSLEAGNLSVRNDISTGGILNVGTALTIGNGGFISQGNSAVYGSFTVGTSTYPNFLVNATNNTTNIGTSTGLASLFIQGTSTLNPFTVASSSGASLFTILANGNIGVASSTPYAKLDIYNGDQSTGVPSIRSFTPNGTYGHLFEVGNTGLKILSKDNGTLTFGRTASSVGYGRLTGSSAGISFSTSLDDSTYTERMNLSSSGVLGIGTSAQINASNSPAFLNVLGKIVAGDVSSPNGGTILEGRYGEGGALTVLGTEQSSGGPVLGYAVSPSTSAPGAFLSSYGLTSASRSAITVADGIKFYVQSSTSSPIGTPLSLAEAMKITTDGNVGIGTTTPSSKLFVVGDIRNSNNINSSGDPGIQIANGDRLGFDQAGTRSWTVKATGGNLDFASGDNLGYAKFNYGGIFTGSVGIGTVTPGAPLSFADSVEDKIQLNGNNSNGYKIGLATAVNGGDAMFKFVAGSTSAGEFGFYNTTNARLFIASGGNIGIGTTTPGTKLVIADGGANGISFSPGSTAAIGFNRNVANGDIYNSAVSAWQLTSRDERFSIEGYNGAVADSFTITKAGNVGIGTTTPSEKLEVNGFARINGVRIDPSIGLDQSTYFTLQPHAEGGTFPLTVLGGNAPTFVTSSSTAIPFGKVMLNSGYGEYVGDYVPVQPGETLYGEVYTMRESGASGTAGVFYMGIARYDKDKKPIADNNALQYFIAGGDTIPTDGVWTKRSGTATLPTSHASYGGSDGGPVRYVRPYLIVNYTSGTIPTYWAGAMIRRVTPFRDTGVVAFNGNVGIGTTTPSTQLSVKGNGNGSMLVGDSGFTNFTGISLNGVLSATDYNITSGIGDRNLYINRPTGYETVFREGNAVTNMVIKSGGNVGIGTTTPATKLQVSNGNSGVIPVAGTALTVDSSGNNFLSLLTPSANSSGVTFGNVLSNVDGGIYYNSVSSRGIDFRTSGNSTRMVIDGNGNVGVGTTTPGSRLTVSGTTTLVGSVAGPTALRVMGNIDNTTASAVNPFAVGSVTTGSSPQAIAVSGRYAYVANYTSSTLQIIDITTATSPAVIGSVTTGTNPQDVVVVGNYAYVVNYTSGTLQIINVSNPTSPSVVSSLIVGANPYAVRVVGKYAHIINSTSATLQIVDISNPASPVSVGVVSTGGGDPFNIAVSGNYAYVTNYGSSTLKVIDISTPALPAIVGTLTVGSNPRSVAVSGRYAYVANTGSGTVQVVDVSSSTAPTSLSTLYIGGGGPFSLTLAGRYVYIVDVVSGVLKIIDVGTPASPVVVGTASTDTAPRKLIVSGRYGYVINSTTNSLQVFDIGGLETSGATIANIEAGTAQIRNDLTVQGGIFASALNAANAMIETLSAKIASFTSVVVGQAQTAAQAISSTALLTLNLTSTSTSVVMKNTTTAFSQSGSSATVGVSTSSNMISLSLASTTSIGNGIMTAGPALTSSAYGGANSIQRPDGKFLVIVGGVTTNTTIYDPSTNTFSAGPALNGNANEGAHSIQRPDGKFLVVRGFSSSGTDIYDPVANTFASGPSLSSGTANGGAHSIQRPDGKYLVVNGGGSASTNIYDPVADSFSSGPSFATGTASRGAHSIQRPDGKFLVINGNTSSSTNIYDPIANTFTAGPALATGTVFQGGHSIQRPDGKFLVISAGATASTNIYDPIANIFTVGPSVATGTPNEGAHSIQRPDGKFLLINGNFSNRTNIYDPVANTFTEGPVFPAGFPDSGSHSIQLQNGTFLIIRAGSSTGTTIYNPSYIMSGSYESEDMLISDLNTSSLLNYTTNGEGKIEVAIKTATSTAALAASYTTYATTTSGSKINPVSGALYAKVRVTLTRTVPTNKPPMVNRKETNVWRGDNDTKYQRSFANPILYSFSISNQKGHHVSNADFGSYATTSSLGVNATSSGPVISNLLTGDNGLTLPYTLGTPGQSTLIDEKGVFQVGPALSYGTTGAGAHSLRRPDGKILLVNGGATTTTNLFDPNTSTFSTGPTLTANAGAGAHAYQRPDGKFLIILGNSTATTNIYDPVANTLTAGPSLATSTAGAGATSVQLPNGKFLTVNGNSTQATNIYDPLSNTFATGPLVAQAQNVGAGAFFIKRTDGKFLFAHGGASSYFDIYDPVTNTFSAGPGFLSVTSGSAMFQTPEGYFGLAAGGDSASVCTYDPRHNISLCNSNNHNPTGAGAHAIQRADGKILILKGAYNTGNSSSMFLPYTNLDQQSGYTGGANLVGGVTMGDGAHSIQLPDGKYLVIPGGATSTTNLYDAGWAMNGFYESEYIYDTTLDSHSVFVWKGNADAYKTGVVSVRVRTATSSEALQTATWRTLPVSGSRINPGTGEVWAQIRIEMNRPLAAGYGVGKSVSSASYPMYNRQALNPSAGYANDAQTFVLPTIYSYAIQKQDGQDFANFALNGQSIFRFSATGDAYTSNGGTWNAGGADLAEFFPVGDAILEPGDVVSVTKDGNGLVAMTTESYDDTLLGVVATAPGLRLGSDDLGNQNKQPIALAGRVPVKITLEGGVIKKGDYLTSASRSGYAKKAVGAGRVIGIALEDYTLEMDTANNGNGKVLVFVNPHFYLGSTLSEKVSSQFSRFAVIMQKGFKELGVTLADNGNVGIGVESPLSRFQVNGDIRLGVASSTSGAVVFQNAANGYTTTLRSSTSTLTSNLTFTLPDTLGTASQAIVTDGEGNLSFTRVAVLTGTTTSNQLLRFLDDGTVANSSITDDNGAVTIRGTASSSPLRILSSTDTPLFTLDQDGNVSIKGSITTSSTNVATRYLEDEPLVAGDIVTFSTSTATSTTIRKSLPGEEAIGIVATSSGIILGSTEGTPVALTGSVLVNVSNENGDINQGDYLTISTSAPGYAMKLTENGFSLGRALTSFATTSTSSLILVSLELRERVITLSGTEGLAFIDASSTLPTLTVRETLSLRLSQGYSVVREYIVVKVSAITGYFDTLFAKEIFTDKVEAEVICLKDNTGETCINKAKLDSLLLLDPRQGDITIDQGVSIPDSDSGMILGTSTQDGTIDEPASGSAVGSTTEAVSPDDSEERSEQISQTPTEGVTNDSLEAAESGGEASVTDDTN